MRGLLIFIVLLYFLDIIVQNKIICLNKKDCCFNQMLSFLEL